jgi:hypothetical protein
MVCGERDLDNRVRGHTQLREVFGALDGCQDVLTPKDKRGNQGRHASDVSIFHHPSNGGRDGLSENRHAFGVIGLNGEHPGTQTYEYGIRVGRPNDLARGNGHFLLFGLLLLDIRSSRRIITVSMQ